MIAPKCSKEDEVHGENCRVSEWHAKEEENCAERARDGATVSRMMRLKGDDLVIDYGSMKRW